MPISMYACPEKQNIPMTRIHVTFLKPGSECMQSESEPGLLGNTIRECSYIYIYIYACMILRM